MSTTQNQVSHVTGWLPGYQHSPSLPYWSGGGGRGGLGWVGVYSTQGILKLKQLYDEDMVLGWMDKLWVFFNHQAHLVRFMFIL